MNVKAIPTRIIETRSGPGEPQHCTWEVQLYDDLTNTTIRTMDVDLFIEFIKSSKIAYNNHLRSQTVKRAADFGYTIASSDVIIL